MSSSVSIYDFRLSFIWVETYLDLLREPQAAEAPLAFLGRSYTYEPYVGALLNNEEPPPKLAPEMALQLPWAVDKIESQHFWERILEGVDRPSPRKCWKSLVPLRWKIPVTIAADWLPGRVLPEAFFYPQGMGLIVTAYCHGRFSPTEMAKTARDVRKGERYQVDWPDGRHGRYPLEQLATQILRLMRRRFLGAEERAAPKAAVPFSILTVIQGSELDPTQAIPDGGEIHRVLEAVTTWSNTWPFDKLPALPGVSMLPEGDRDSRPDGHIVYIHRRARAVWLPGLFRPQDKAVHYLACYHRNLSLQSLTVESLAGFARTTRQHLDAGGGLSAAHRETARRAAGMLGRFYGGARNSYRSWSPRPHLAQNGMVNDVNALRRHFGKSPLH